MAVIANNKNRVLSVFQLVMINVIALDSLRNLPSNAAMGLTIPAFYIIATVLFLIPSILTTAEMATHYPKMGGAYVWVREAFGPRVGLFSIWLQWIYNVFWYPTILAFIAANIAYLINPALATEKYFMVSSILILFSIATAINCFGMRLSGLISTLASIIGTLIPMLFIIALGAFWFFAKDTLAISPHATAFIPAWHSNNIAFIVVLLFSLMGLEMSATHAEEVKNPVKNFPRALLFSALLVVLSASLSSTAIALIVPAHDLNIVTGLDQAFAIFLTQFHLKWVLVGLVLAMILGGFGNMSAWVIGPTKSLAVAAEDGYLPKLLAYRSNKNAPLVILLLQALVVFLICGLFLVIKSFNTSYWILSDLTAQLALLFYVILFLAAIRLRYKTDKKQNAFRIGWGNKGIWVVGLVGALTSLTAFFIGFIPTSAVEGLSLWQYEMILIIGVAAFCIPPFLLFKKN